MTANGLLGELAAWTGLATPPPAAATAAAQAAALAGAESASGRPGTGPILDVCDRVIGETSERSHVLEWLRPTGDGPLTVDAYYPRNQLVVICQNEPAWHDSSVAESLRSRGLELFRIDLSGFRGDSGRGFSQLIGELRRIAKTPPAPPTVIVPAPPPTFPPTPTFPPAPRPGAPTLRPSPPAPRPSAPHDRPSPPADRPTVSGAFEPFRAAVHRFTAAPEPFVLPTERPTAASPPTGALPAPKPAPPPVSEALQQYLRVPRPAPPPPRPAPPPPLPQASRTPPAPASPPSVSDALGRYMAARPSTAAARAPAPAPAAAARPTPAPAAASRPYVATPLPFTTEAPRLDPVLEHLLADSAPEPKRHRVGQRQAEAAARAARFVEARTARSAARAAISPRPAPAPLPAPDAFANGTWAARAATAFPGLGLSPGPDARASSVPTARAQAIDRALARGRSLAVPERPPGREQPRRTSTQQGTIDPDNIPLAMLVTVIVLFELIVGVVVCMSGGGPVVLGFGLVLDAAARVVGTVSAVRSGQEWGAGWRWICGLGGSPGVVAFAFQGDGRLTKTELAPLAGPLAVLALLLILVGVAGIPVGI